jgi:hypothetical protein
MTQCAQLPRCLSVETPSTVYLPPQSPGEPDYILSRIENPTHFHLVCERSPCPKGFRGFAADCPLYLPKAELSESAVTIPHGVSMGPSAVSRAGWCDRL